MDWMDWGEPRAARRPSPTPEQILAGLRSLDGGPAPVGPLAFAVCRVMGVETGARGSYALRGLVSWSGYVKKLRALAVGGQVQGLPLARWRMLSGGVLFAGDGRHGVLAYATAEKAAAIWPGRQAPPGEREQVRQDLALRLARERVLAEHGPLVGKYTREWLKEHPAPAARSGVAHG